MKNEYAKIMSVIKGLNKHPLTQDDREYRSCVFHRVLQWQFRKRYANKGKIVPWFNNKKLVLYPGRTSAVGNYYYGLLEYESMSFLYHYLKEDDVFYDIGANCGVYTVVAAGCRSIIAFEPADDTYQILFQQVDVNNIKNAILEQKGVSDFDGISEFTIGRDATNHIIRESETIDDCVQIETVSLDSYIDGKPFPSVMKIDAEGAEENIIRGGTEPYRMFV